MRDLYDRCGRIYPDLCFEILEYFSDSSIKSMYSKQDDPKQIINQLSLKCPLDFSIMFDQKFSVQPSDVNLICERMCELGYISKVSVPVHHNIDGATNFYRSFAKLDESGKMAANRRLNSAVYGFRYIYESNKENVLPVFVKKRVYNEVEQNWETKQFTGSCFRFYNGIVTAKHCLVENEKVEVHGISADILNNARILTKPNYDLLFIELPLILDGVLSSLSPKDADILERIITMGYPTHGGFDNFITVTSGEVAAIENCYIYKHDLMLLSCPIKGGNSGGPIINRFGEVVGIATEVSIAEGENYDNFGYGISIPMKYVNEIVESGELLEEKIAFVDNILDD